MGERLSRVVEALAASGDPRLDDEYWRVVPATEDRGAVVLVGVVHDHPASAHRVASVVAEATPDVLALELPRLAVPYFVKRTARSGSRDAGSIEAGDDQAVADGGQAVNGIDEMSAAIGAATNADVVGVDTFSWRFWRTFLVRATSPEVTASAVRDAIEGVGRVVWRALSVRFGSESGRPDGDGSEYRVDAADDPVDQASHERSHVSRSRSLLGALERPAGDVLFDEAREATMATNVDALRTSGTVVAVVGLAHLDAVADQLTDGEPTVD
ncbi:hypothetical protein [Halorubellus salinus]|uniref:hypothetical protein n=1 Tax=Halorubellus salinus TaxID=755309 RepID=UPI001D070985|nr:hypothetical protein [Halorubellus salinus]